MRRRSLVDGILNNLRNWYRSRNHPFPTNKPALLPPPPIPIWPSASFSSLHAAPTASTPTSTSPSPPHHTRTSPHHFYHAHRRFSSPSDFPPTNAALSLASPCFTIWGANTGVGKTLFSAGLIHAAATAAASTQKQQQPTTKANIFYLKPVQTGFPTDSDARLVYNAIRSSSTLQSKSQISSHLHVAPHAAALLPATPPPASPHGPLHVHAKTLYAWRDPVSPHIAVEREGRAITDGQLTTAILDEINSASQMMPSALHSFILVETAGGVNSPTPSGSLQSDALRPLLRLPGILVGDGRLGGISCTLSAYESLVGRGFEVPCIVLMDGGGGGGNAEAIQRHVDVPVTAFPPCLFPNDEKQTVTTAAYRYVFIF